MPDGPERVDVAVVDPVRGDRDAEFTAFAERAMPALGRTAWLLCGDRVLAEELVQQALVRTYVAWPAAVRTEPLAYARRVLANSRIDHWRRRRREVLTGPDAMPDGSVHDGTALLADRDEVARALSRLPDRRRRVVVLRYAAGLSEREVAEDLGISLGAVKSASSRGLAQLRAALAADHGTTPAREGDV